MDQTRTQDEQDNRLITELLNAGPASGNSLDFLNRELEPGEKANDAEDFEDIGDDDLADDEDVRMTEAEVDYNLGDGGTPVMNEASAPEEQDAFGEDDDNFDELFGDRPSSPAAEAGQHTEDFPFSHEHEGHAVQPADDRAHSPDDPSIVEDQLPGEIHQSPLQRSEPAKDTDHGASVEDDPELREQQALFAQAQREREERLRRGGNATDLPAPPQTNAELFETIWPHFEQGKPPRFHELLGVKRAFYLAKKPIKLPKPIHPTRVELELMQDQERSFKLPYSANLTKAERQARVEQENVIIIAEPQTGDYSSDDEVELDSYSETENVAGVNMYDLSVLCEDWEIQSSGSADAPEDTFTKRKHSSLSGEDSSEAADGVGPFKVPSVLFYYYIFS